MGEEFTIDGMSYYVRYNGLVGPLAAWDVRYSDDGSPVCALPPIRATTEQAAIKAAKRYLNGPGHHSRLWNV